jgi:hypothetical protein
MSFSVEGDRSERQNFGNVDSAVEYIKHRPHENFTVYNATQTIIDEIRRKVNNTIRQG